MIVQTVGGGIELDALGATLMHEHLVIAFEGWRTDARAAQHSMEDLVSICVDRVEELKDAGFKSLLDPCPNDIGRDVELYAEVSARTGFNILFATGLYHEQFAAPYWKFKLGASPDAAKYLASVYVSELTQGVGASRLRPAVIKLAVGLDPTSRYEQTLLEAAAIASNETSTPILTHTEGVGGDLMLKRLMELGVDPHQVIVGHSCGSPDRSYHRRIVDEGAYIGFDRFSMTAIQSDTVRAESLHALIESGHEQSLIVSHDCVFCQRGGMLQPASLHRDPLTFQRVAAPMLREKGVSQATLDGLFTDNPRRFFEGAAPRTIPKGTSAPADVT